MGFYKLMTPFHHDGKKYKEGQVAEFDDKFASKKPHVLLPVEQEEKAKDDIRQAINKANEDLKEKDEIVDGLKKELQKAHGQIGALTKKVNGEMTKSEILEKELKATLATVDDLNKQLEKLKKPNKGK